MIAILLAVPNWNESKYRVKILLPGNRPTLYSLFFEITLVIQAFVTVGQYN